MKNTDEGISPYTLAVGDRVRDRRGDTGRVTENDGAGFTVTWDHPWAHSGQNFRESFRTENYFIDGEVWPFRITHLEDIS